MKMSFHSSTALPMQLQIQYNSNITVYNDRERGILGNGSASITTEDIRLKLPSKILTASHLSSLRDLVSNKKITGSLILQFFPFSNLHVTTYVKSSHVIL